MQLSIIVCTQNRAYAIAGCLESIVASLVLSPGVTAEIVVVDNASTDDTSAVVEDWASSCAYPVQLLYEPKKGLSVARNCAVRAAKGALLVFTDDDCRMSPSYIADALRYDAGDIKPVLRGGRIELGDTTDLPLTIIVRQELKRWAKIGRPIKTDNLGNSLAGCNMVMRKSVVDQLGYFDESLGAGSSIPGGEDIDYFFRAYLADIDVEYVPDMTIIHYHGRKTKAEGWKLFKNYSLGGGALYAKYFFKNPDLCRQFYWDLKLALKEIVSQKNTYMPEIGFSHRDKVYYCVVGAFRYLLRKR